LWWMSERVHLEIWSQVHVLDNGGGGLTMTDATGDKK
jgi:hypothetical protein